MEEEKKLPKNIRQMAEKEERVRVYLEDYAYTFIRKLNCTGHVYALVYCLEAKWLQKTKDAGL